MGIIRAQMAEMSLILAHILLKWYIQKDDSDSQRISLSLRLFKLWKMRLRRRQENLKCKDDLYIGYTTFKKWFVLFQFPLSTAKWNIFRIFSRTICSTKEKEGKKGFIKRLFRHRILVTNNREFWLNFCIVFCFFFFFLPSFKSLTYFALHSAPSPVNRWVHNPQFTYYYSSWNRSD